MDTVTEILEWAEYNEIINRYWWVGVILAVLIVAACLIIRWIRNWVV